jgi:hypothetical protein
VYQSSNKNDPKASTSTMKHRFELESRPVDLGDLLSIRNLVEFVEERRLVIKAVLTNASAWGDVKTLWICHVETALSRVHWQLMLP